MSANATKRAIQFIALLGGVIGIGIVVLMSVVMISGTLEGEMGLVPLLFGFVPLFIGLYLLLVGYYALTAFSAQTIRHVCAALFFFAFSVIPLDGSRPSEIESGCLLCWSFSCIGGTAAYPALWFRSVSSRMA